VGEDWVKASNLVSNGAFFLKEWVPHDRIELDRNPHYHNVDNVALSKVIFHPLTDEGTAMKRFRAGELDIAGGVPIRQMEYLSKILPGQIRTFPDMAAIYLVPNMDVDGLNDVRVRKALSLATDRRALTEKVLKGMGIPAFRFTPPNVSHYDAPGLALKDQPMAERLDQARALLAQAGYGPDNPLQFQLRTTDSESARSVVVAVRSMWQQVGVDAQIYSTEVKTHYADLSRANFEMAVATYYGWDDPNEFLSLFTAATGQMSFNYGRYNNPKFDTTLDQALEIADIKVRHQKMADAEQIMLEDLAVIPIFYPVARTLVSNKLENYLDNSLNVHPSEYLSLVNGAEAE
jgi:oligopeptide transport system substrate-binding protein